MPHYRKLTTDLPETPVIWHYLPISHHVHQQGRHHLTLTDHDGSVIRTTVDTPEHVVLLGPYLHLYELEQLDPWTHGPAMLPVEQTENGWRFAPTGAVYDRAVATGSGTADNHAVKPCRPLSFQ